MFGPAEAHHQLFGFTCIDLQFSAVLVISICDNSSRLRTVAGDKRQSWTWSQRCRGWREREQVEQNVQNVQLNSNACWDFEVFFHFLLSCVLNVKLWKSICWCLCLRHAQRKREREDEVNIVGDPLQVSKSSMLYKISPLLSLTCLCFHCNVSAIGTKTEVMHKACMAPFHWKSSRRQKDALLWLTWNSPLPIKTN